MTWIRLFPQLWQACNESWRTTIEETVLPGLFQCSSFLKQSRYFPNVVQSLLSGIYKCNSPPIELSPVIINYAAKTFNCWHLSTAMLEEKFESQLDNQLEYIAFYFLLIRFVVVMLASISIIYTCPCLRRTCTMPCVTYKL